MTNSNIAYCVNSHNEKIFCGRRYNVHNLITGSYMFSGDVVSVTYDYKDGIVSVMVHLVNVDHYGDFWVNIDAIKGE